MTYDRALARPSARMAAPWRGITRKGAAIARRRATARRRTRILFVAVCIVSAQHMIKPTV